MQKMQHAICGGNRKGGQGKIGYVKNQQFEKATGWHFNQKGHSVSDMQFAIIEKVFSQEPGVRKERESLFIKNFNSKHKGINKTD